MAHEFILTERHDDIAVITLNRPEKLNALSFGLVRELDEALTEYESDDAVKAVILTGAGERAFSAGADIHEMAGLSGEELAQRQTFRGEATWHIASFAKPLIGAINGLAYGGAALLSSTLDLRIGCERTQFRFLASELWPGQFDLVIAVAGRAAKGQGIALHRPGGRPRGGRAHRFTEPGGSGGAADRDCGRNRSYDC